MRVSEQVRARLRRRAVEVAPELIGWRLRSLTPEGAVTVLLTEVEAYEGGDDPASHAWRGRTPRNSVMFGPAGHLYCYFSYGMHWCANVTCAPDGVASAVLLRGGEVVEGIELARTRRGLLVPDRELARGPARLTRALGIDGSCNGADLVAARRLSLLPGSVEGGRSCGPRVGIRAASDRPWRFWATGHPTVSAYRSSPRSRSTRTTTARQ